MEIGTAFAEVYISEKKQGNLGLQKNLALYKTAGRQNDPATLLFLFGILFVCRLRSSSFFPYGSGNMLSYVFHGYNFFIDR